VQQQGLIVVGWGLLGITLPFNSEATGYNSKIQVCTSSMAYHQQARGQCMHGDEDQIEGKQ
jgi:hypothetical protein